MTVIYGAVAPSVVAAKYRRQEGREGEMMRKRLTPTEMAREARLIEQLAAKGWKLLRRRLTAHRYECVMEVDDDVSIAIPCNSLDDVERVAMSKNLHEALGP